MWCEKLENGKFKYRERFTDPMTGKSRIVSITMDRNSKQAERIAREILQQKMNTPIPSTITLKAVCDMYLAAQEPILKPSTWTRNKYSLTTMQSILGPNTRLESMTAGFVRQQLQATGKDPGTLNELLTRFKAMIRWAYKNDVLNDIRFIDKLDNFRDTSRAEKVQDKYLENEELTALLESIDDPVWHDLTLFLALSGLRIGEAMALTRSDLDLDHRIISVTKTYDTINDITTTPKTFHSEREVYMQDELFDLCKYLLAANRILSFGNLLFVKDGERISYNAYRVYLRKHSQKSIGRPITPHVLRHTHASLLMEQGVDMETIADRLGHDDSELTKQIYAHVTKKLQDKRNEELRKIKIFAP